MWPVNAKTGIKKMRQYTKNTWNNCQKEKQKAAFPTTFPEHLIYRAENQTTE